MLSQYGELLEVLFSPYTLALHALRLMHALQAFPTTTSEFSSTCPSTCPASSYSQQCAWAAVHKAMC